MKMKATFNSQHSIPNSQRVAQRRRAFGVGRSALNVECFRSGQRGVALVVTLILLAVTLVMAVAFLAISRRERNAVVTTTDTAIARLASDSALTAAQAQIAANVLSTNPAAYDFALLVSTNYVNDNLSDPNYTTYYDPTTGNLLTGNAFVKAATNQWAMPRPPVFVSTNTGFPMDFRYYLDLNRNGLDEGNGPQPVIGNVGYLHPDGTENNNPADVVTNLMTGDPEWIGVLEHPDQPHGPNNRFSSRYCFFAQPIGNSLDLNYIHNQTLNPNLPNLLIGDGYFRNEGVGSWEINLAAFLADLNTNLWDSPTIVNAANNPYTYREWFGLQNTGAGFEDARALLAWRYGYNYNSLAFPSAALNQAWLYAGIDGYSVGNLMTTNALPLPLGNNLRWAGSDNTNHFFALPSDLFDPAKSSVAFTNRLLTAGNPAFSQATYDRYTFYRMLEQLGTDSQADDVRMNLNFKNVVNGAVVPGMETNLIPWNAEDFFTNAADRMLRAYTTRWFALAPTNYLLTYYDYLPPNPVDSSGVGLTNFPYFGMTNQIPSFGLTKIPVYLNSHFVYPPAVNRLLQVAANLYDASTNTIYPAVFRPQFTVTNGDVYISGFTEVSSLGSLTPGVPPLDRPLSITGAGLTLMAGPATANGNVYGVPWIIGAKKGLPGFNQFFMRNAVQVTRKMMISRDSLTYDYSKYRTNEMFVMSITNRLGVSFWNSYNSNYPAIGSANITVHFDDAVYMVLSNYFSIATNYFFTTPYNSWPGSHWDRDPTVAREYRTPLANSFVAAEYDFPFVPESVYRFSGSPAPFVRFSQLLGWETNHTDVPVLPDKFELMTTNWMNAYILANGRVIDYVSFNGPNRARDITQEMVKTNYSYGETKNMWDTSLAKGGSEWGVVNQFSVSRTGPSALQLNAWRRPPNMPSGLNGPQAEAAYFDGFFFPSFRYPKNGPVYVNTNLSMQLPYTPTRTAWDLTIWQANDPLVHYLAGDLTTITPDTGSHSSDNLTYGGGYNDPSLTDPGIRYQPWGKSAQMSKLAGLVGANVDTSGYNLSFRDPLVWGSDYWDFPSSKYPTPGWIGRVHRGTPWQTLYLKATNVRDETGAGLGGAITNIGQATWAQWSGDTQTVTANGSTTYYDSRNSAPVQDGLLFDLFTSRFNDNSVKGALSVNQSRMAAWSAVLSGVVALSNATAFASSGTVPVITNVIVEPAGAAWTNSPLGRIVVSINETRASFVSPDGITNGVFENVGDVLRAPALTEQSPFLNTSDVLHRNYDISDELYEWLPQQIMGLLHVSQSPRYVVYVYGQTLRPAPNSLVLSSGPSFGLCTNYQVTAESAARAVIRVNKNIVKDSGGNPTGTNYTTTVESYNVLPPD